MPSTTYPTSWRVIKNLWYMHVSIFCLNGLSWYGRWSGGAKQLCFCIDRKKQPRTKQLTFRKHRTKRRNSVATFPLFLLAYRFLVCAQKENSTWAVALSKIKRLLESVFSSTRFLFSSGLVDFSLLATSKHLSLSRRWHFHGQSAHRDLSRL
jgi:hypothetical protein